MTGTGRVVARAGWGKYITRNRHYFGLTAQDRLLGIAVRIEDPNQLRNYPNIDAVLGGKSLADYVASGAARSVYIIPDDYVLPESQNTTVGFGWQIAGRHRLRGRLTSTPTATTSSARWISTCRRPAASAPPIRGPSASSPR